MPIERRLDPFVLEDEPQMAEALAELEAEAPPLIDPYADLDGVDPLSIEEPTLMEEPVADEEAAPPFLANLVNYLDDETLDAIGNQLREEVERDIESRRDWDTIAKEGLAILGVTTELGDAMFDGASIVTHPLLLEAIVKYHAKARSQIMPPEGPAKARILGLSDEQKRARAKRVTDFMNYQIMEQMVEYSAEHDRMLITKGLYGTGITKTYYDPALRRPVSKMVQLQNFAVDYHASDLDSAERITEILRLSAREYEDYVAAEFYADVGPQTEGAQSDDEVTEAENESAGLEKNPISDDTYKFYEVQAYLDIPELTPEEAPPFKKLPYIITLDASSDKVLSIYRNWAPEDLTYRRRPVYTHWTFIPGFGFYGFGYLHLIGGLSSTATKLMRQLIDAGTFANFPAGFKAHGLRILGNNEPLMPGEWRDVNAVGVDLDKAFKSLPYKEPSPTLMALLEFIVVAGQRFADSVEQIVNNAANYGPVNTTLALIEAGGQMFQGIHERLYDSQKRELQILYDINKLNPLENYPYDVAGATREVKAGDFAPDVQIVPVTDPRTPSEAHRLARTQAHLQIAAQFPDAHNLPIMLMEIHQALGADDAERFVNLPGAPPAPMDPLTENARLLTKQPVSVGPQQDHNSHLAIHLMGIVNNPLNNQQPDVIALTQAHLQDHLAAKFRQDVERLLGQPLPPPEQITPEQEYQLSALVAELMPDLLQQHYEEAMALSRLSIETDPVLVLENRRLDIEAEKVGVRAQEVAAKTKVDASKAAGQLALGNKELTVRERIAQRDQETRERIAAQTNEMRERVARIVGTRRPV